MGCEVLDGLQPLVEEIMRCSVEVGSGIRDWLTYLRMACGSRGSVFEELVGNAVSVLHDLDNLVAGLYGVRLPLPLFVYTRRLREAGEAYHELYSALRSIARLVCGGT